MLYFIYGEDDFRSEIRLKEVLSFYLKKNPFFASYEFNKEENPDINQVRSVLLSKPLFKSIKVILFKNLFEIKDNDYLLNILQTLKDGKLKEAKDTLVIFYENKDVNKNELKDWLIKNALKVEEFKSLTDSKLINWIKQQENQLKIRLTPEARQLIVFSLEGNSRLIYNILTQISRFKKNYFDKEFLEKYLNLPIKTNIFEFLDSVSLKKMNLAFKLLKKEIEAGSHPLYLFKMIVLQFRNLIKIKSLKTLPSQMPKKLNLHPYVYKKLVPISKNYTLDQLKNIYLRLLFYDRKIKDGSLDPELSLELFLLDLRKIN